MFAQLGMFGRYALGLRQYLSETTSLPDAQVLLKRGLDNREQSLLATIRHGIWDVARSPYLPLFRWAGIEWGDVERLVTREGVDEALRQLHRAGVRIALDEFKGNSPIRRSGLEYAVSAEDFDSPLLNPHFEGLTGGTRGVRRRLLVDLTLIAHDAAAWLVVLDSLDARSFRFATWRAVPPNNSGIKKPLMAARIGIGFDRWFSELPVRWGPSDLKYAAFTAYTVARARSAGKSFPYPEHVPRENASAIVQWMATMARAGTPVYMDCSASAAVRICASAMELGQDISGSLFRAGSEPLTEARASVIQRAGAHVVTGYSTSETGPIAMACGDAPAPGPVHILMDKMAVIHATQDSVKPGRENILHLTTILPSCPKILLNVDTGDSGTLEHRPCACGLGKLGFDLHLHGIQSHEKLTSEGILLTGSEVTRLMEAVLPAAFGGAPTDYQLVEDRSGSVTRIQIVASPRLGELNHQAVTETFLDAMSATGAGGRLMAEQLKQADTVSVLRREPYRSPIGKMLPLHVIGGE